MLDASSWDSGAPNAELNHRARAARLQFQEDAIGIRPRDVIGPDNMI